MRKLRIDKNKSAQDLANFLGVTSSYISAVERGEKYIPLTWFYKLNEFYKLNIEERRKLADVITKCHSGGQLDIVHIRECFENVYRSINKNHDITIEQQNIIYGFLFGRELFEEKEKKKDDKEKK